MEGRNTRRRSEFGNRAAKEWCDIFSRECSAGNKRGHRYQSSLLVIGMKFEDRWDKYHSSSERERLYSTMVDSKQRSNLAT